MCADSPETDETLSCLSALAVSAEELRVAVSGFLQQAGVSGEPGPLALPASMPAHRRLQLLEQISAAVRTLTLAGNRFRRAEARALYDEGLTMAQLAKVFGVSRQRVSALLHDDRQGGQPAIAVNGNPAHGGTPRSPPATSTPR